MVFRMKLKRIWSGILAKELVVSPPNETGLDRFGFEGLRLKEMASNFESVAFPESFAGQEFLHY